MYTHIYYVHICYSFTHVNCKHTISYIGCMYYYMYMLYYYMYLPWSHDLNVQGISTICRLQKATSELFLTECQSKTHNHHEYHHHHPYTKGCPHPMDHKNHVDPSCVVFMVLFELPVAGATSNNIKHRPMRSLLHVAVQYLRKITKVTASYEVEIFKAPRQAANANRKVAGGDIGLSETMWLAESTDRS